MLLEAYLNYLWLWNIPRTINKMNQIVSDMAEQKTSHDDTTPPQSSPLARTVPSKPLQQQGSSTPKLHADTIDPDNILKAAFELSARTKTSTMLADELNTTANVLERLLWRRVLEAREQSCRIESDKKNRGQRRHYCSTCSRRERRGSEQNTICFITTITSISLTQYDTEFLWASQNPPPKSLAKIYSTYREFGTLVSTRKNQVSKIIGWSSRFIYNFWFQTKGKKKRHCFFRNFLEKASFRVSPKKGVLTGIHFWKKKNSNTLAWGCANHFLPPPLSVFHQIPHPRPSLT